MKTFAVSGRVDLGMLDGERAVELGAVVMGERVLLTVDALDEASAIREARKVALASTALRGVSVIRLPSVVAIRHAGRCASQYVRGALEYYTECYVVEVPFAARCLRAHLEAEASRDPSAKLALDTWGQP